MSYMGQLTGLFKLDSLLNCLDGKNASEIKKMSWVEKVPKRFNRGVGIDYSGPESNHDGNNEITVKFNEITLPYLCIYLFREIKNK